MNFAAHGGYRCHGTANPLTDLCPMRYLSIVLLSLAGIGAQAQPFTWQWSISDSSTFSFPDVLGMATDALGNSYVAGRFYDTARFGDLPPVTSAGQGDVFVVKYDNSGTALWVTTAGGADIDFASDLALDAAGNVTIVGQFRSSVMSIGSTSLTLVGNIDLFVAKLDGSDGSVLWSQRYGSNDFQEQHYESANAVAVDADGNAYVSGCFRYTLAVPGLETLQGCGQYNTSFVLKLDPDGNGVWSRRTDCTKHFILGAAQGQCIAVGPAGDLYVAVSARGDTLFYETDTILNVQADGAAYDVILAKYDLDGNYQWARPIGGMGYDEALALAADAEGNAYIAIDREGMTALALPGIAFSGSSGVYRSLVVKFGPDGTALWGARLGNSTFTHAVEALIVEDPAHILVAGWHRGNFQFDDVPAYPTPGGSYGLFLARYDSSGVLGEFHAARGQFPRGIRGIGQDGGGNLYVAGYYQDSLSFPGLPAMDFTNSSTRGMFLARSGDFNTGLATHTNATSTVYPNPTGGTFAVHSAVPFTEWRIVNTLGASVAHERFAPTQLRQLDLHTAGVFAYTLWNAGSVVGQGRVVVQR
jgi:hypothetical protein